MRPPVQMVANCLCMPVECSVTARGCILVAGVGSGLGEGVMNIYREEPGANWMEGMDPAAVLCTGSHPPFLACPAL